MLVKLTDLEADRRVGRDGRYHPHRTVRRRRRRHRHILVRKGRRRRPVDVAVVGLTVHGGEGAVLPVVAAASFVEAASEAGQAGAQRSETVL